MDVNLLWFECSNPHCDYLPFKNKKEKIKRAWQYGESITKSARPRTFLRYVKGLYHYFPEIITFECKYGNIIVYDDSEEYSANSYYYPIKNAEICNICMTKIDNERRLQIC